MTSKLPQQAVFLTPDTLIELGEYAKRHDVPMAALLKLALMHGTANPGVFSRKPSTGRTERVWCYVPVEVKENLKWRSFKTGKAASRLMAAAVESFLAGLLAEEEGKPTAELKRTWQLLADAQSEALAQRASAPV